MAESIGPGLAKAAVAVRLDDSLLDLSTPIESGGKFSVITLDSEDGLDILRHSSAHVMAQAVLDLYEGSTFAIGPAIEDGFYYDFDVPEAFDLEDLDKIQAKMEEIVGADQPFERVAM
ncbi:MAG: threonine--tRNA ligase, partial [Acidimicrobiia bacterium]